MFREQLKTTFKLLTECLETAIQCRDFHLDKKTKSKYRKLASHLEKSLSALDNAINLIGE